MIFVFYFAILCVLRIYWSKWVVTVQNDSVPKLNDVVLLHFKKFPSGGGLTKNSTISLTLSTVATTIPRIPKASKNMFLASLSLPDVPSNSSQKTVVCITEGAINANVDVATAPVKEIKRSILGIIAAKATWCKKEDNEKIISCYLVLITTNLLYFYIFSFQKNE